MGHGGDTAALTRRSERGRGPRARSGSGMAISVRPSGAGMRPGERRLLAAMPLHAITALHGETGLRERLAMEVEVFADADRDRITRALDLAARLHVSDRRQREPYLSHLLRVAIRIVSHYRVRDPDVVCAALLHDSVEDHATELAPGDGSQQGALGVLAEQFGDRVASLVASVTNPPHEPGRDRHEQYREHVAASLERDPWARVIKASDFTDNGVGLIHTTGPKLDSLAAKYAPLVPVAARSDRAPGHPAERRCQAPHPRPARPRRSAVRRDPVRRTARPRRLPPVKRTAWTEAHGAPRRLVEHAGSPGYLGGITPRRPQGLAGLFHARSAL